MKSELLKKFVVLGSYCLKFLPIEISSLRLIFNDDALLVEIILLEPISEFFIASSFH